MFKIRCHCQDVSLNTPSNVCMNVWFFNIIFPPQPKTLTANYTHNLTIKSNLCYLSSTFFQIMLHSMCKLLNNFNNSSTISLSIPSLFFLLIYNITVVTIWLITSLHVWMLLSEKIDHWSSRCIYQINCTIIIQTLVEFEDEIC